MSTRWSSRGVRLLGVLALLALALDPGSLYGQEVQDGKWKVPPQVKIPIFFNASGAAQHVMITVCVTSGADVTLELEQNALTVAFSTPQCMTVRGFLATGKNAFVGNGSGSNATGTYVVTLVPF